MYRERLLYNNPPPPCVTSPEELATRLADLGQAAGFRKVWSGPAKRMKLPEGHLNWAAFLVGFDRIFSRVYDTDGGFLFFAWPVDPGAREADRGRRAKKKLRKKKVTKKRARRRRVRNPKAPGIMALAIGEKVYFWIRTAKQFDALPFMSKLKASRPAAPKEPGEKGAPKGWDWDKYDEAYERYQAQAAAYDRKIKDTLVNLLARGNYDLCVDRGATENDDWEREADKAERWLGRAWNVQQYRAFDLFWDHAQEWLESHISPSEIGQSTARRATRVAKKLKGRAKRQTRQRVIRGEEVAHRFRGFDPEVGGQAEAPDAPHVVQRWRDWDPASNPQGRDGRCWGCHTLYDPEIARMGLYATESGRRLPPGRDPHKRCPHASCAFRCTQGCYPVLISR